MNENVVVVNTKPNNNKKNNTSLIAIILLVLVVAGVICFFIFGNKDKDDNKDNNGKNGNNTQTTLDTKDSISCGDKCVKYTVDPAEGKAFKVNYKNDDVNFDIELVSDGEESNVTIKTNGEVVVSSYGSNEATDYYKIYAQGDLYVIEYRSANSSCGEIKTVLFTKTGEFIGIPAQREIQDVTVQYEEETGTVNPSLYKTEINGDTVVAYKKVCGFCSEETASNVIGYKYTYKIEDGTTLTLQNKEEIHCSEVA